MRAIFASVRHVGLKHAVLAWHVKAADAKSKTEGMRKTLRRLRAVGLTHGFNRWVDLAHEVAARTTRVLNLTSEAAARLLSAHLAGGFFQVGSPLAPPRNAPRSSRLAAPEAAKPCPRCCCLCQRLPPLLLLPMPAPAPLPPTGVWLRLGDGGMAGAQWRDWAMASKDANRLLHQAADGLIPTRGAFAQWQEVAKVTPAPSCLPPSPASSNGHNGHHASPPPSLPPYCARVDGS